MNDHATTLKDTQPSLSILSDMHVLYVNGANDEVVGQVTADCRRTRVNNMRLTYAFASASALLVRRAARGGRDVLFLRGHGVMQRPNVVTTTRPPHVVAAAMHATSSSLSSSTPANPDATAPAARAAAPTASPAEPDTAAVVRTQRVLSGVQPTGALHLGNYLGAMRQWADTQQQNVYDSFFFVVDLHAITLPHDRRALAACTRQAAAMYLACGVDPARATVFVQSHVRAHAELTWLLNCNTPIGWLERMIQYKEKAAARKHDGGESPSVGLFDYPVLMSADVLLYQADLVPVGEDQRQHIELARDIARRYNDLYCKKKRPKTFREPKALMQERGGARVMSLEDGTAKMSKSAPNDSSRINLVDPPATIRNKIKRCKTDSAAGLVFDAPDRPECHNLLSIYQLVTDSTKEEVAAECADMRWGQFKPLLADALVAHLEPIQNRYADLMNDPEYLNSVLRRGADVANQEAEKTLDAVKRDLGLLLPSDIYRPADQNIA
jgi:tryptophanyl-tRNA synthetase